MLDIFVQKFLMQTDGLKEREDVPVSIQTPDPSARSDLEVTLLSLGHLANQATPFSSTLIIAKMRFTNIRYQGRFCSFCICTYENCILDKL